MVRKQGIANSAAAVATKLAGRPKRQVKSVAMRDVKNEVPARKVSVNSPAQAKVAARKGPKRSRSATTPRVSSGESPVKRSRSTSVQEKKAEAPKIVQKKKPAAKKAVKKAAQVKTTPVKAKRKAVKTSRGQKRASDSDGEDEVPATKKARMPKAKKERELAAVLQLPESRHGRGSGILLACGCNDCGQLGMPQNVEQRKRPQRVPEIGPVLDVAAGGLHSVVLTAKGEVYTFGNNDEGGLGRNTEEEEDRFEVGKVDLPGKAYMISAGDAHSAALLQDGRVFVWGIFKCSNGDLGLVPNIKGKAVKPVQIMPGIQFVKIASGENHMVLLSETGHAYTFGCPEQGQLGRIGERLAVIGSSRKGIDEYLTPGEITHTQLSSGSRKRKNVVFSDIWAGGMATYVKAKDTGKVFVCGLNNYNQIASINKGENVIRYSLELNNELPENVTAVAGGQHHSLVLADGKVYSLGSSTYGRLGTGDLGPDKPIQAEPVEVGLSKKCVDIGVGTTVSYAITEDGESFSWGMGTNGQLGTGSEDDEFDPYHIKTKETEGKTVIAVSGGGQHTLFVVADRVEAVSAKADTEKAVSATSRSVDSLSSSVQNSVSSNGLGELGGSEGTLNYSAPDLNSSTADEVFESS